MLSSQKPNHFQPTFAQQLPRIALLSILTLSLVVFSPLVGVLELHHLLGAADQDGHQHSASDLCSWVQSHASSSIAAFAVVWMSQPIAPIPETPYRDRLVLRLVQTDLAARGPPSLSL
jgi:hypothetical protein